MNDERDMKQVVISTVGVAMLVSSCSAEPASSDERPEAPTTTSSSAVALATLPPPSPEPSHVEWAENVVDVVNTMQLARTDAIFGFQDAQGSITRMYDSLVERLESELVAIEVAVDELPMAPDSMVDANTYALFVAATDTFALDAAGTLDELRRREAELRTDEREQLSPPLLDFADSHAAAVTRWQSACFELQNVLADLTDAPLDCIGLVRGTDQATADPTGEGDTADGPPSSAGSDETVTAADVTVDLHCRRGASSDDLPFDTTPYDFLTPARGRWILSRLSITNDSTARIQLDDDFRVRWYDEDGATLATTFWPEGYAPALTARGGQHVVRTGLGFEDSIRGMGGEQLPAELLDAIFGSAAGCELAAPPTFTTIDDDAFIAPELAGHVEITDCTRDDRAGRWFVGYRITNPTDRVLRVQMTAELVDVDGNRLGMGGGTHPAVEPGATVEAATPGYSVLYTIDQPDRVDRCELFAVEIE